MKHFMILVAALAVSYSVFAGFPPSTTCSNIEGYIVIADRRVTIKTMNSERVLVSERFEVDDLDIKMDVVSEMPEQKRGCTSREVTFMNVTLAKKDGSALPNAYNRNANKGILDDYMICSTKQAWMPAPGESCFK